MKTKPKKIDLKGFQPPKTSEQEVLLHLILLGSASIEDFPFLSGFRTRISQIILNHGLFLEREWIFAFNQFGNSIKYGKHYLPESEKEKAIELYNKLNSESKQKLIKT